MIFLTDESELEISCSKVSLYFYAPWIPYHNKMLVMINKMEEKYKDVKFFAIDTDNFKNLCKRFSVDSVPSVVIMNDRRVKKINGVVLTSAFKNAYLKVFL